MHKKFKQVTLFILDKSGSMSSIQRNAISGFNEYINTLKHKKVDAIFNLTLFDSISIEKPYRDVRIKNVKPLTERTYKPLGNTPLYDAVVNAIEAFTEDVRQLEKEYNVAASVVIMTDGEENDSKTHDEKCLKDLIKQLTNKGNWTFAYLGANQDAWANAAKFGISMGNTFAWESSIKGTKDVFRSLADASGTYSINMAANAESGKALNSASFFNQNSKGGGVK